jgi:hypothetical protein
MIDNPVPVYHPTNSPIIQTRLLTFSLNDLAVRVVSHGERFTSGQRVSGLIRGYDAIIVDGAKSSRLPTNIAYEIYGADAVTRQQVVWPDAAGRYPWDALYGYAAKVQPLIGRPRRS